MGKGLHALHFADPEFCSLFVFFLFYFFYQAPQEKAWVTGGVKDEKKKSVRLARRSKSPSAKRGVPAI